MGKGLNMVEKGLNIENTVSGCLIESIVRYCLKACIFYDLNSGQMWKGMDNLLNII